MPHASDSSYSSVGDRALLRSLHSSNGEKAAVWKEFLRRYSSLILKIAWQYGSDHDAVMDAYLHVCRRLAADDFAKLRSYDPSQGEATAKVSTWLTVVVRNLCIEHYRQATGRRRYPEAVSTLSAFDQKVFELRYWKGYSPHEIAWILEPSSDDESVGAALRRLRDLDLRPSWDPARHESREFTSFRENDHSRPARPGKQRSEVDRRHWIDALLDDLPDQERLAIRWSYWEEVSAWDIGRFLQVSQRKVYTLLNRAVRRMRRWVEGEDEEQTMRF